MSYSTQDESDYSVPSESEEEFAPQQPKARGKKAASNKLTINDLSDTDVEPVKQKTTASNGRSVVPKKNANKKQATLAESLDSGAGSAAATPISAATAASSNSDRPVEEIYQKKSQLEHILLRPDTYIGSVEPITETMWVYNDAEERMVQEAITYSPGLYKIVDEILVNAADNKIRDSSMDTIKVTANKDTGVISVYNNGKGIPVQIHSKEGVYVPELIFGHLLTSSNYNDNQKKVTGGRNGYGAKLCNIFSVEFIVETADASTGKKYRQVFKNNMSVIGKPSITAHKNKSEWTKITFKPDFGKFHMQGLEDGIYELIRRRVYDLAGCVKRVKVYFNEKRISINSFKKYAELYLKSPAKVVKDEASGNASDSDVSVVPSKPKPIANYVHEVFNDRWEVIIAVSEGQFHQVSFVNSINTVKGGTHVNHVVDQVTTKVIESISKKNKKQILRPYQVKNYLWVFVNSLIENAAFDSQTKETLTLRQNAFGSRCE
ncbi:DNA topoisomerase 2, partial [Spiromyces aspiralis]